MEYLIQLIITIIIMCVITVIFVNSLHNIIGEPMGESPAKQSNTQQLSALYYGQIPRKNVIGLAKKLNSIKEFAYFVLLMKPDAKRKLIHRNELTAEQLLEEYQHLNDTSKGERADLFMQWKDNVEHFEANKIKLHTIKTNVIEFRLR